MRYVIAVGGNAITKMQTLKNLSIAVIKLYREGNEVVITHGNGPQVGALATVEKRNLAILTAQTQAELGLEIENSLIESDQSRGDIRIAPVLTRVLVDRKDKEFKNPSKPIGRFVSRTEAQRLRRKGFVVRRLFHGYRRVVPSPKPKKILEAGLIDHLLKNKYIVIAAGGGGIAVLNGKNRFSYADAVIDKDFASSLLAVTLHADRLFILTNVDGAYLDFGSRKPKFIRHATPEEMLTHIGRGQFEEGSMLPKVEACMEFVKKTGNIAVIGNLEKAKYVFGLNRATVIRP